MVTKYIWYCRVSTKEQEMSGLWLENQQSSILFYIRLNGGVLVEEVFIEIESGKENHRPVLMKAIEKCKVHGATLLIAKLDRLSRNLHFITELMESKVSFKAVDMPEASDFTIHILAAVAQKEREMISARTKAALAILKKNGKQLGTPANLTIAAREKAWQTNRIKALLNPNNKRASAYIKKLNKSEMTYQQIANELNEAGYLTSRGKSFDSKAVWRLYKKINIPQNGSFSELRKHKEER